MIYQLGQIKTILANSNALANAAGVASMSNRVFIKVGEVDMVGGVNLGRLPVIFIKQLGADYTFEAEPGHQGTRKVDYTMRILVPTFLNRSDTQYNLLERIKAVALEVITETLGLGITDVRVDAPQVTQTATAMDVIFTSESSYDSNYDEGN